MEIGANIIMASRFFDDFKFVSLGEPSEKYKDAKIKKYERLFSELLDDYSIDALHFIKKIFDITKRSFKDGIFDLHHFTNSIEKNQSFFAKYQLVYEKLPGWNGFFFFVNSGYKKTSIENIHQDFCYPVVIALRMCNRLVKQAFQDFKDGK